jgi:hypothetical protein
MGGPYFSWNVEENAWNLNPVLSPFPYKVMADMLMALTVGHYYYCDHDYVILRH